MLYAEVAESLLVEETESEVSRPGGIGFIGSRPLGFMREVSGCIVSAVTPTPIFRRSVTACLEVAMRCLQR
jgi:hypothetical protein